MTDYITTPSVLNIISFFFFLHLAINLQTDGRLLTRAHTHAHTDPAGVLLTAVHVHTTALLENICFHHIKPVVFSYVMLFNILRGLEIPPLLRSVDRKNSEFIRTAT